MFARGRLHELLQATPGCLEMAVHPDALLSAQGSMGVAGKIESRVRPISIWIQHQVLRNVQTALHCSLGVLSEDSPNKAQPIICRRL